jgi:hypothetical protein
MWFRDLTNDCIAYIGKLAWFAPSNSIGSPFLSGGAVGYGDTNYLLDDIRHGHGYNPGVNDSDFSSEGYIVSSATNGLLAAGVAPQAILFFDGLETITNGIEYNLQHPTGVTNLAGFMCWGAHSSLANGYARNGTNSWGANSSWWIIETVEAYNGWRDPGQGNFTQWFSDIAFGGSNDENTPVGAVSHTDEPTLGNVNDPSVYFGLWASGKSFAIAAWNSRKTPKFQAVGDPFVKK